MSKSKVTIRPAQISDLTDILTLFVATISTICKDDYSPEQIKVWTASIENTQRWKERLVSQYFLVAQLSDQIVGFASLEANNYLDLLYVHKDYQGQGIAGRLYSGIEAETITQRATVIFSDVSITAKSFFEKKGFSSIQAQTNTMNGVEIINYKMAKQL